MDKSIDFQKRDPFIDFLRGIAIFCVLWGHAIQYCSMGEIEFFEDNAFRFIYSFHMPLFMGISGYVFAYSLKRNCMKKILKKQVLCILIPTFIWGAVCGLINSCFLCGCTIKEFISETIDNISGAYWYLWTLLTTSLLMALFYNLRNLLKNINLINENIYIVLCGFFTSIIYMIVSILPCRIMSLWLLPYFVTGILLHNFQISKLSGALKTILFGLCTVLYVILLHWFHKPEYIYTSGINPFDSAYGIINQIGIDLFRWILGFVGIVFIVGVAKGMYKVRTKIDFVIRGGYLLG